MAALIAFVVQNSHSVQVSFRWMRGSLPLASALLSAVAGTALVTAMVGVARGRQLRQRSRRG